LSIFRTVVFVSLIRQLKRLEGLPYASSLDNIDKSTLRKGWGDM
jgi:hypothetical protein